MTYKDDRKRQMVAMLQNGSTQKHIANIFGLSKQRVSQILSGTKTVCKSIREKVRERDGNRCVECGKSENPHVHHVSYSNAGKEKMEDLITLCVACHNAKHNTPKKKEDLVFPKSFGMTHATMDKLKQIADRMELSPSGALRRLVDERVARWKIKVE